jgi:ferredoxin
MKLNARPKAILMTVLTICLCLIVINVIAEAASKWQPANMKNITGVVKIKNELFSLNYGKEMKILNLAPPAALDSLQLHPADSDTLIVTGIENKGAIVCSQVIWKGKAYILRDPTGTPVWKGTSTWATNPKKCIGCRLCFMNCPSDAITMVNNKSVIDQSKCSGCNTCIVGNGSGFKGCPVKAITK